VASFLLLFEVVIGLGLIGPSVGFVTAGIAFWRAVVWKDQRRHLLRVAAIYATLCIASFGAIVSSSQVAFQHADPVIAAVERFRAEHGCYPHTMDVLVPAYLPSIPRAGFTWVSRRYFYNATRPQLYFPAMFHGVYFYDFPTKRWVSNE
jgi:hypothetical protein